MHILTKEKYFIEGGFVFQNGVAHYVIGGKSHQHSSTVPYFDIPKRLFSSVKPMNEKRQQIDTYQHIAFLFYTT